MKPTVFWANYYGFRLDASDKFVQGYVDGMRLDQRGQGVACGRGWIPRSKKCSPDKAKQTSKEAKAKTVEKSRERAKLKGEVNAAKGQKPRVKETKSPNWGEEALARSNEAFFAKVRERKQREEATQKEYESFLDTLPSPKPANPQKFEAFEKVFGGRVSNEDADAFMAQALQGKKFKRQEINLAGESGAKPFPAQVIGDLALVKNSDLHGNPNRSGYSITHVPSGGALTNINSLKQARGAAAALLESGIDWSGDPRKITGKERDSFLNLMRNLKYR
jgi:hypothetical protein